MPGTVFGAGDIELNRTNPLLPAYILVRGTE